MTSSKMVMSLMWQMLTPSQMFFLCFWKEFVQKNEKQLRLHVDGIMSSNTGAYSQTTIHF